MEPKQYARRFVTRTIFKLLMFDRNRFPELPDCKSLDELLQWMCDEVESILTKLKARFVVAENEFVVDRNMPKFTEECQRIVDQTKFELIFVFPVLSNHTLLVGPGEMNQFFESLFDSIPDLYS